MKLLFPLLVLILFSCEEKNSPNPTPPIKQEGCMCKKTKCNLVPRTISWAKDSSYITMEYHGPEFIDNKNGDYFDVAHRLSTVFVHTIDPFLKRNYLKGSNFYRSVDLKNMEVTFKGNPEFKYGSQKNITYRISAPILFFKEKKYSAKTSIEHKGSWVRDISKMSDDSLNAWKKRIRENYLLEKTLLDEKLIEYNGFKELWVQWHDKAHQ
jgi:hypothetical protein